MIIKFFESNIKEIRSTNRSMVNSWYYWDPFFENRYQEQKNKLKEERLPLKVK